jgi:hypothetical protein
MLTAILTAVMIVVGTGLVTGLLIEWALALIAGKGEPRRR